MLPGLAQRTKTKKPNDKNKKTKKNPKKTPSQSAHQLPWPRANVQLKKQAKGTYIPDQMMLCRPCPDFSLYPLSSPLRISGSLSSLSNPQYSPGRLLPRCHQGAPSHSKPQIPALLGKEKSLHSGFAAISDQEGNAENKWPQGWGSKSTCCGGRGRVGYSHTCAKLSPDKGESRKVISVYQNEFIYTSNMMPQRKQQSTTANQRVGAIW